MCFVTPIKNRDRLALKLVGPAGEVPVADYGGSNVDHSRDRDWHTVVQGFKIGKLIGIVFNKLGEAAEQTSSLWCLSLAPRSLFERCPGRSDRLLYVGRTSMEVGVEVTAEDLITREIRKIASSYVIYVALGENGKPTPVPPLVAADDEEKAMIERARTRRLHRQKIDAEFKQL